MYIDRRTGLRVCNLQEDDVVLDIFIAASTIVPIYAGKTIWLPA
ncbi:MAG: hypothetical protein ACLP5V_05875 [Candidatus Bathyarchaeia archaeon]